MNRDDLEDDVAHAEVVTTEAERTSAQEAASNSPRVIYEVIRQKGLTELTRPALSLIWSGVAAGILISFSVLGEATLRTYLPDTPSAYLIENTGYSLGFVLVILSRMQLFTENTITTVLPFMVNPTAHLLGQVLMLWGIVLSANLLGAFGAAAFMVHTPAISPDILPAIRSLSEHATGMGAVQGFARGIPAGVLIAAIVWMMPQAAVAQFWIVVLFTWLIAAGDFTHIVAGSVEMAFLLLDGGLSVPDAAFGFFLPVLAGNVVGGTAIFALLVWGQVRPEIVE